jgi:23S rRNA (uracil1939-C5)-methyltransferase
MALARSAELAAKANLLREAFRRTGGTAGPGPEIRVRVAGRDLGYRGRVRVHLGPSGQVGLLGPASHRVVEIPHCPVGSAELNQALECLRELGRTEPRLLAPFAQAELRSAPAGPRLTVHLVPRGPRVARELRALASALEGVARVSAQGYPVPEDHTQRWPLYEKIELWAPPGVFTQVNWEVNRELVKAVLGGALARGVRSFLDLYAGAGNFSLPMLGAGLRGVGVEASELAAGAARRAADAAGFDEAYFVGASAEAFLGRMPGDPRRFELVVLDPPRLGCRTVVEPVAALGATWLALCSCDPVTLARDLRLLLTRGYQVDELIPFDMFPHTHHLETLVWLRRRKPRD